MFVWGKQNSNNNVATSWETPSSSALSSWEEVPSKYLTIGDKQYQVISHLDEGGQSTVKKIKNENGDHFAMKVCLNEKAAKCEIGILTLLDHPNIVKLIEYKKIGWTYHLIYHLYDINLYKYKLECGDNFNLVQTVQCTEKILSALIHAHEKGIFHDDIKPQNILLDRPINNKLDAISIEPVICDFGSSKKINKDQDQSQFTMESNMATTLRWSPMEVNMGIKGGKISPRSDLYGVGAILFFLISGKRPYYNIDDMNVAKLIEAKKQRMQLPESIKMPSKMNEILESLNDPIYRKRFKNGEIALKELKKVHLIGPKTGKKRKLNEQSDDQKDAGPPQKRQKLNPFGFKVMDKLKMVETCFGENTWNETEPTKSWDIPFVFGSDNILKSVRSNNNNNINNHLYRINGTENDPETNGYFDAPNVAEIASLNNNNDNNNNNNNNNDDVKEMQHWITIGTATRMQFNHEIAMKQKESGAHDAVVQGNRFKFIFKEELNGNVVLRAPECDKKWNIDEIKDARRWIKNKLDINDKGYMWMKRIQHYRLGHYDENGYCMLNKCKIIKKEKKMKYDGSTYHIHYHGVHQTPTNVDEFHDCCCFY